MNTSALVKQLKEAGQDHEFYPTTTKIIEAVYKDLRSLDKHYSIMDIGAGDGNVLNQLESMLKGLYETELPVYKNDPEYKRKVKYSASVTKYAIEKSPILIEQMPADIFVVGTEFHEQSLIDKKMDIIFCNPPYSEYKDWMDKILTEANATTIYMVVPDRWKSQASILAAINKRKIDYHIIGNYSFEDSEFRKARANVNLIRFRLKSSSYGNRELESNPFDIWFDSHFKIQADIVTEQNWSSMQGAREKLHNMIKGQNLIERLAELYVKEFEMLLNNYKAVELLNAELLKELDINIIGLKAALKLKIEGLKNKYWQELFDNLDTITEKLTESSRKSLLDTLSSQTSVDFTASNAYAVVIWAIKNANKYFDSQLLNVHEKLLSSDNAKQYKSNSRILSDDWRYERENYTHYSLDYRIVHNHWNTFLPEGGFGTYDYHNNLSKTAHGTISDIITIAKNLGFKVIDSSWNKTWHPGKIQNFCYVDKNDKVQDFADIKAFKNGNLHFKFSLDFMRKFNVEAGRLHGWIKSPVEASQEMDIPLEEATEYFTSNIQLLGSQVVLLNAPEEIEDTHIEIVTAEEAVNLLTGAEALVQGELF